VSQKTKLANKQLFCCIPEDPFGTFLRVMFSFVYEESQRRIAERLNLSRSLVSCIYRRLQDLCPVDLENRSVLLFGGPGATKKVRQKQVQSQIQGNKLNRN